MPPGPVSGREKAASDEAAFSNPELMETDGAPGAIRTPDPLVRSQILYPTELRVRMSHFFSDDSSDQSGRPDPKPAWPRLVVEW